MMNVHLRGTQHVPAQAQQSMRTARKRPSSGDVLFGQASTGEPRRRSPRHWIQLLVAAISLSGTAAFGATLGYSQANHVDARINKLEAEQTYPWEAETDGDRIVIERRFPGVAQPVIDKALGDSVQVSRAAGGFGSGTFIRDADGRFFVLTNRHVVSSSEPLNLQGEEIFFVTPARSDVRLEARLVKSPDGGLAKAQLPDVALLEIIGNYTPESYLDVSSFRDFESDPLEVGEPVILVGNLRGLTESVTEGIISSEKERRLTDIGTFIQRAITEGQLPDYYGALKDALYIQSDATCGPGGSGGALYDAQGRLIGIHRFSFSEDVQGLCFSIRGDQILDWMAEQGVRLSSSS